jgi:Tol biopolymer transport system component
MNTAKSSIFAFCLLAGLLAPSVRAATVSEILAKSPDKIVCEGYVADNWEIFMMNADGSDFRNLTNTPGVHELYPQVSPDGKRIAFVSDVGEGRTKIRSLWVMDIDGKNRKKIADYARQPFWAPDSKTLGYLPQEYKKFNGIDFATKGMVFHDMETGKSRPHPNAKLHHLYNPGFSPDGKWIAATVHGGMGFKHADILIQADGDKVVDLKVHGCRPCFSPDGKFIAWGASDHKIEIASIDLSADPPVLGKQVMEILDKKNKIYHVDWAPDGKVVTISRGKAGKGDASKPGTIVAASEVVGVHAAGWDIFAVSVEGGGTVDMNQPPAGRVKQLTKDGNSHKESDWVPTGR